MSLRGKRECAIMSGHHEDIVTVTIPGSSAIISRTWRVYNGR